MLIRPQNSLPDTTLVARLTAVRSRIAAAAAAAHRDVQSVTLLAVSKGQTAETVRAAAAAGQRDFGESYLQEALAKTTALADLGLCWHFIGRVQANKTRSIAMHFDWVHGIDRLRIAERLSEQRPYHAPPLNVCVQVNVAADEAKAGVEPAAAAPLLAAIARLPHLRPRGLMGMVPERLDAAGREAAFRRTAELLTEAARTVAGLDTLSMGMSEDFEVAIRAGATIVRIGTAIFGPRAAPARADVG